MRGGGDNEYRPATPAEAAAAERTEWTAGHVYEARGGLYDGMPLPFPKGADRYWFAMLDDDPRNVIADPRPADAGPPPPPVQSDALRFSRYALLGYYEANHRERTATWRDAPGEGEAGQG